MQDDAGVARKSGLSATSARLRHEHGINVAVTLIVASVFFQVAVGELLFTFPLLKQHLIETAKITPHERWKLMKRVVEIQFLL